MHSTTNIDALLVCLLVNVFIIPLESLITCLKAFLFSIFDLSKFSLIFSLIGGIIKFIFQPLEGYRASIMNKKKKLNFVIRERELGWFFLNNNWFIWIHMFGMILIIFFYEVVENFAFLYRINSSQDKISSIKLELDFQNLTLRFLFHVHLVYLLFCNHKVLYLLFFVLWKN